MKICKICKEKKDGRYFYRTENGLDSCCSACRAKQRILEREVGALKKRYKSEYTPLNTDYVKVIEIDKCPTCGSIHSVGKVVSTNNNNVVQRYYCRNCFIEFDSTGNVYQPLL